MKTLLAMITATTLSTRLPYDNISTNYSRIIGTTQRRYRYHNISQTDLEAVLRVITQPLI